jgi:hypothetical protein
MLYRDRKWLTDQYIGQRRTMHEMARLSSCSVATIHKWMRRYGIQPRLGWEVGLEARRKHHFDADFFRCWSHELAYVVGYAIADGCVYDRDNQRALVFVSTDREILDAIVSTIGFTGPLYARDVAGCKRRYSLVLSHNELFKSVLPTYGLVPRKSLIVEMPDVPTEFLGDFLRGNLDGDGTVSVARMRPGCLPVLTATFMSGSRKFVDGLQAAANTAGMSERPVYQNKSLYSVGYSSARDIVHMYRMMYPTAGHLFLPRKRQRFVDYFSTFMSRIGELRRRTTVKPEVLANILHLAQTH